MAGREVILCSKFYQHINMGHVYYVCTSHLVLITYTVMFFALYSFRIYGISLSAQNRHVLFESQNTCGGMACSAGYFNGGIYSKYFITTCYPPLFSLPTNTLPLSTTIQFSLRQTILKLKKRKVK